MNNMAPGGEGSTASLPWNSGVFSSWNNGMRMSTLWPRLALNGANRSDGVGVCSRKQRRMLNAERDDCACMKIWMLYSLAARCFAWTDTTGNSLYGVARVCPRIFGFIHIQKNIQNQTFLRLLTRMFFVSAPNRGCGLMMASGMYAEFATGPRTCHFDAPLHWPCLGEGGPPGAVVRGEGAAAPSAPEPSATKSPTPMSGKHVIVGATSPGRSTLRIRLRRSRILRSTLLLVQ